MHIVQRKYIKLEWVSVVMERRINGFHERHFEVHVVSQEGVDGEVGAISLMYSVELIAVLIILAKIKCIYLNTVVFCAEVIF